MAGPVAKVINSTVLVMHTFHFTPPATRSVELYGGYVRRVSWDKLSIPNTTITDTLWIVCGHDLKPSPPRVLPLLPRHLCMPRRLIRNTCSVDNGKPLENKGGYNLLPGGVRRWRAVPFYRAGIEGLEERVGYTTSTSHEFRDAVLDAVPTVAML